MDQGAIHLAGATLGRYRHVCAFFHQPDEEYRVLLPFVSEGMQRGEKAFHIVGPHEQLDHRNRLRSVGIDVEKAEREGSLEIKLWEQAYLRDGHFDQQRMLTLIEEVLQTGHRQNYPLTRLVAHMEWALEDRPGVNDLVEYETRLNFILPKYEDPVVWTYSTAKFGGGIVVDIMRTHPMFIIGGVLQENPFFVPPDEFLRELAQRR